jgi:hypothetical protein
MSEVYCASVPLSQRVHPLALETIIDPARRWVGTVPHSYEDEGANEWATNERIRDGWEWRRGPVKDNKTLPGGRRGG